MHTYIHYIVYMSSQIFRFVHTHYDARVTHFNIWDASSVALAVK